MSNGSAGAIVSAAIFPSIGVARVGNSKDAWLLGPEVTAKYGGGLMWIATLAIVFQVFYNLECGRYALYCGEPIFTGFMRTAPGPRLPPCSCLPRSRTSRRCGKT